VRGLSSDGKAALAMGSEHENWSPMPLRIDLTTGDAQQLGGMHTQWTPEIVRPAWLRQFAQQRYWRTFDRDDNCGMFDLDTGELEAVDFDRQRREPILRPALRGAVMAEKRRDLQLWAPGARPVWIEHGTVVFGDVGSGEERVPWPIPGAGWMRAVGHGVEFLGNDSVVFDLAQRRVVEIPRLRDAWVVGDVLLFSDDTDWALRLRRGDDDVGHCEPLRGCQVLGLLDDARVLAHRRAHRGRPGRLFTFDPATGAEVDIDVPSSIPSDGVEAVAPMYRTGSLLERDPEGRVWLHVRRSAEIALARLDAATLTVAPVRSLPRDWGRTFLLMAWNDLPRVVVQDGARILRVDIETGATTVLFPRP
jgi:hypothetical protein